MKNLYADRLAEFTFDEMLGALQAISQETHRLDFKRMEVGRPRLAHLACAFANADGGIIAIGFHDPVAGQAVALADPVDITDRAKTALVAAINARVHPPLTMELGGFASADGESFLVIRIERSDTAPHEYIHPDLGNLPVRRDSQIGALRLSEIDALRARSQRVPFTSALEPKPHPPIWTGPSGSAADIGFSVRVAPAVYSRHRVILDADDDKVLTDFVEEARGAHGAFFGKLTGHPSLDGIHFYEGVAPAWQEMSETKFAREQVAIDSDGEVTLRFLQTGEQLMFQYFAALAAAYIITQRVFYHFGLGPFADLYLRFQLDIKRPLNGVPLPEYYEDRLSLDLATQSFTQAYLLTTVRMLRVTKAAETTERVRAVLEGFERNNMTDLRAQWR